MRQDAYKSVVARITLQIACRLLDWMRKGSRERDFLRMEASFVVLMSQESDDAAD